MRLAALESKLTLHARGLDEQITGVLKDYFDPRAALILASGP